MPTQLTALGVTKTYEGRTVLSDVTCSFAVGGRTGIIGENGSGKTTLLRLLAGLERPDQGEIVRRAEGGLGHLAQDGRLAPHLSVQGVVDLALRELRAVEVRMRELEATMADSAAGGDGDAALAEYGELLTAFELRGGYDADARVERALHGLGLGRVRRDRLVGALSGGEQVRLRLAAVLASSPEVLLLDEPTNHLDDSALTWLEDHLRTRHGTTVAVSHDRVFLERVATTLLEVDGDRRQVARYGNGYSGYLTEKAAERQRWAQEHARWQAETDRLRQAAATTARRVAPGRAIRDGNKMAYDRAGGRVQQSLAGRVRSAEERLRRLLARPVPPPPEPLRFTPSLRTAAGPVPDAEADTASRPLLDAAGIAVPGRLAPVDVAVAAGGRLLVTGPNGAGKSTLLSVLAGSLTPAAGHVTRHGRTGLLPQEPVFRRPDATLLEEYARGRTGTAAEHAERLLSLGLFARDRLDVPVGALSTGQRQRLALARLVTEPVDVLLLDEPTNHLSLALVEQLEAALEDFAGALVVVSHDRRLRQRWHGSRLALRPVSGPAADARTGAGTEARARPRTGAGADPGAGAGGAAAPVRRAARCPATG